MSSKASVEKGDTAAPHVDEITPVAPARAQRNSGTTLSVPQGLDKNAAMQGTGDALEFPLPSPPDNSGVVDVDQNDSEVDMSVVAGTDGDVEVSMEVNPVELSNYIQLDVVVDIDLMDEPVDPTRELHTDHQATIRHQLEANGYRPSSGRISIALREDTGGQMDASERVKDGVVSARVWVLDGRHRKTTVKELREEKPDVWAEVCKKLPVSLWLPKDETKGPFIPMHEIIELGARLNSLSSTSLETSFYDNVVQVLSTARNFAKRSGIDLARLSVRSIASRLEGMKALGGMKQRQLQRYVLIARRIAFSEKIRDRIRHGCRKFGLSMVHLSDPRLMAMSNKDLTLTLDFICEWVSVNKMSFSIVRASFLDVAEEALLCIGSCSTAAGISLSNVLRTKITLGRKTCTLYDYLVHRMGNVGNDTNPATFVSTLKKQMAKVESLATALGEAVPATGGKHGKGSSKKSTGDGSDGGEGDAKRPRRSTRKKTDQSYKEPTALPSTGRGKKRTRSEDPSADRTALVRRRVVRDLKSLPSLEQLDIVRELRINLSSSPSDDDIVPEQLFQESMSKFDDTLPSKLPLDVVPPKPVKRTFNLPYWARKCAKPMPEWYAGGSGENPVTIVQHYLEAIFVPPGHRANLLMTADDIRANHHVVYTHGAANFLRKNPDYSSLLDVHPRRISRSELLVHASEATELSPLYFVQQATELREKGYCILEGFLNDEDLPDKDKSVMCRHFAPWGDLDKLSADMEASFPKTDEAFAKSKSWTWIANRTEEEDERNAARRVGRMYSTNYGVTTALEQDASRVWASRMRAKLDVRLTQSFAALRVHDNCGPQKSRFYIPQTGGRWLLTSEGCGRQELHTDYEFEGRKKDPKGYFLIACAKECFLWVCEYSHKILAFTKDKDVAQLSKGMVAVKVRIAPNSIFVGRGDTFHAGVSYKDLNCEGVNIRYHLYLSAVGYELPDGIHLLSTFKPRFVDPELDSDSEASSESETGKKLAKKEPARSDPREASSDESGGSDGEKADDEADVKARGEKDESEGEESENSGEEDQSGDDGKVAPSRNEESDEDVEMDKGDESGSNHSESLKKRDRRSPSPPESLPAPPRKAHLAGKSQTPTRPALQSTQQKKTPDHISETPLPTPAQAAPAVTDDVPPCYVPDDWSPDYETPSDAGE